MKHILLTQYIYQFISEQELSDIGHYIIIFICIFVCCFLGSFIRDAIYASKNGLKVDIKAIVLYDMPCAFVVAALSDIFKNKVNISGWAFISLFIGLWSREVVAILMNSKFVTAIIKVAFGSAVEKAKTSMTDDEKESLKNAFKSAIDSATEDSSSNKQKDLDKVGEFEWIDILEQ